MDEMVDMEGVNVGGLNINNIRYADDTVLTAETTDKLQRFLDAECNRAGLNINMDKTEVIGITKRREQMRVKVVIGSQTMKQARSFR